VARKGRFPNRGILKIYLDTSEIQPSLRDLFCNQLSRTLFSLPEKGTRWLNRLRKRLATIEKEVPCVVS
jgi:hypothetical protein